MRWLGQFSDSGNISGLDSVQSLLGCSKSGFCGSEFFIGDGLFGLDSTDNFLGTILDNHNSGLDFIGGSGCNGDFLQDSIGLDCGCFDFNLHNKGYYVTQNKLSQYITVFTK